MSIENNIEKLNQIDSKVIEIENRLGKIHWNIAEQTKKQEAIFHATMFPVYNEISAQLQSKQLDFDETIETIIENKMSFSRFGDGEMRLMLRNNFNISFQENNFLLAKKLKEVLLNPVDNLLIGMPYIFHDLHWGGVWANIWSDMKPLLENHKQFGMAHVTRPVYFQLLGDYGVELYRKIWSGLDITIVTGEGSRFELNKNLFDNVKSSNFIYSLPKNAFDDLDRLIEVLENDESDLILVALGPAGTILAYEMAKRGKWILDIGHISSSYENIFSNGTWPEKIPVSIKK